MSVLWNVINLNLKTFVVQKGRIAALFFLTAVLCLAAGLSGHFFLTDGSVVEPITVAVVDLDESIETRMILSAIMDAPEYGELLVFSRPSPADAASILDDGRTTAVITLPEGFGNSMTRGENMPFAVAYNRERPLASALVRVVADAFADMLRSSQMGVYVTLNYALAQDIPQTQYDMIFMSVNMRFIGLVQNRQDMFVSDIQSVTGELVIWQAYFIAVYIALMMCAAFVMTDAVRRNFSRYFIISLGMRGVSHRVVCLACVMSYFLLFLVLNIGLWLCITFLSYLLGLPAFGINAGLACGVVVIAAALAAFAVMLTFVFDSSLSAGAFTAVFTVVSLFLSGGIIPAAYFSESFQLMSNAVFNTWGVRLLAAALTEGNLLMPVAACVGFGLIFMGIGCVAVKLRGRAA